VRYPAARRAGRGVGRQTLAAKEVPPQVAATSGRVTAVDPRPGRALPRHGGVAPRVAAAFPRLGAAFSRIGGALLRVGAALPRVGAAVPGGRRAVPGRRAPVPRWGCRAGGVEIDVIPQASARRGPGSGAARAGTGPSRRLRRSFEPRDRRFLTRYGRRAARDEGARPGGAVVDGAVAGSESLGREREDVRQGCFMLEGRWHAGLLPRAGVRWMRRCRQRRSNVSQRGGRAICTGPSW
jgi:hypothetical protein